MFFLPSLVSWRVKARYRQTRPRQDVSESAYLAFRRACVFGSSPNHFL